MKRVICSILAFIFITLNILPSVNVFADDGYTDSQLADIGTIMLSNLITSGEATELDFSDNTTINGTDFLKALGKLAITGDTTYLEENGFDWISDIPLVEDIIWKIREWQYNISPDLYNLWYNDGKWEIDVTKNQGFTKPLRELLTPRDGDDVVPQPNPDYADYINYINGSLLSPSNFDYDSMFGNYYRSYYRPFGSIMASSNNNFYSVNVGSSVWIETVFQNIIDIYIFSNNDIYSFTINNENIYKYNWVASSSGSRSDIGLWTKDTNNYINGRSSPIGSPYISTFNGYSYSGSLLQVFNVLRQRFKNINIYVDGVPWSIISSNIPNYPIVIPNTLTIFNDQPLQYTFPEPTYLDIPNLKTLITNAINNSTVIKWDDIDDYFVNVNGTPSLPVIQMIRNDYDNMYMEQYPYPATIIGLKDPLKFNEHLLDNSQGYLSPVVEVVENTVGVLPMEIVGVLAIGAILSIFALIINRLLE